jgi:hypothetical protein
MIDDTSQCSFRLILSYIRVEDIGAQSGRLLQLAAITLDPKRGATMYKEVQQYYGKTLQHRDDLNIDAYCGQTLPFATQTAGQAGGSGACC